MAWRTGELLPSLLGGSSSPLFSPSWSQPLLVLPTLPSFLCRFKLSPQINGISLLTVGSLQGRGLLQLFVAKKAENTMELTSGQPLKNKWSTRRSGGNSGKQNAINQAGRLPWITDVQMCVWGGSNVYCKSSHYPVQKTPLFSPDFPLTIQLDNEECQREIGRSGPKDTGESKRMGGWLACVRGAGWPALEKALFLNT